MKAFLSHELQVASSSHEISRNFAGDGRSLIPFACRWDDNVIWHKKNHLLPNSQTGLKNNLECDQFDYVRPIAWYMNCFVFFHRSRYVCFSIVFLNDQLRTVSSAAQHLDTNYWNSLNMSPSNMSQTIGAALQITHRCQSSLDINRSNLPCWFILTGIGWFWMILVDFEIFHFSCPLHHSSPRGGH